MTVPDRTRAASRTESVAGLCRKDTEELDRMVHEIARTVGARRDAIAAGAATMFPWARADGVDPADLERLGHRLVRLLCAALDSQLAVETAQLLDVHRLVSDRGIPT